MLVSPRFNFPTVNRDAGDARPGTSSPLSADRLGRGIPPYSFFRERVVEGVTSVTVVTMATQKVGRKKSVGGNPSWPSNQQRMTFPSFVFLSVAT